MEIKKRWGGAKQQSKDKDEKLSSNWGLQTRAHEQKERKKVFPRLWKYLGRSAPFGFDLPYCIANGRDESKFFFHSLYLNKVYFEYFSPFFFLKMHSLSINVRRRSICYHFLLFDSRFFPLSLLQCAWRGILGEFKPRHYPAVTLHQLWWFDTWLIRKPCPVVKGSYLKPVPHSFLHFWALRWLELVLWW